MAAIPPAIAFGKGVLGWSYVFYPNRPGCFLTDHTLLMLITPSRSLLYMVAFGPSDRSTGWFVPSQSGSVPVRCRTRMLRLQ